MALWGISCLQIFLYFFSTQKDRCYIRCLVVWLWTMDTVHQGLLVSGVYKAIRDNEIASTNNIRLEYLIQILFTILVSTPAQGFFAYRIWMFSNKSKLIISFLAPTILFQLIDGIIFMVMNLPATDKMHITTSTSKGVVIAYIIDGAAIDLFIAITMCLFLWRRYLNIGNATKETRSMIYRLTLFSINTGSWPAIIAIITVAMLVAYPTYYLYAGLYFFLSPVYCNTVLASINARPYIQNVNNGQHISVPKNSGLQFRTGVSYSLHARGAPDELELGSYKVGSEELTLNTERTASLSRV